MHCTSISDCNECYTPPVWNYPNITRPFSILYYSLGGTAFYTVDGMERPFKKDHLYILPANKVFSLREDAGDKFYAVFIHAFTSPEIDTAIEIDAKKDAVIFETLKLIRKYAKMRDCPRMRYLTEMLLSYVFELPNEADTPVHIKLKHYIDENFIRAFNDNDFSDRFNYSDSYLSKRFKDQYNLTPKQYAKQLLLREAVLLLNQGISVCKTAEKLEFSSPENFSRFFKSYYGYSPSQYSKRFKDSTI